MEAREEIELQKALDIALKIKIIVRYERHVE